MKILHENDLIPLWKESVYHFEDVILSRPLASRDLRLQIQPERICCHAF